MPNLVGIGLSQVPTNSMLGGLAYQDPEHASIKDLDLKNLSQINSEIFDTANDVFVYDTRKDSDGGAWRKRTQHTSWYNETLGTEYRGTRREFPAVAVIVSDASSDKVTIYDGDDPDLPMWMVFSAGNPRGIIGWATSNITRIKLAAMNGIMVAGTNDSGTIFKFVEDFVEIIYTSSNYQITSGRTIADRNNAAAYDNVSGTAYRVFVIGWYVINDVSMTVLPNAPIDDRTGLPVPTIAVAHARGISIIMDDGNIISSASNSSYQIYEISILPSGELYHRQGSGSNEGVCFNYPYTRIKNINLGTYANSSTFWYGTDDVGNSSSYLGFNTVAPNAIIAPDYKSLNIGDNRGLTFVDVNKESLNHGMSAFTASNYSTGWMHGDVKGAFLSDTDTTDATYTTVADDWATASAWTKQSSISLTSTGSGTSGTVSITGNGTGSNVYFFNPITVEANTDYVVSITFGAENANEFFINNTQYSTANKLVDINALGGLTRGGHFNSGSNTTLYIQGYQVSTTATTITNVVVQKVSEKDRSVNRKGLQVVGTVPKQVVATGADLVSYGPFNNSNHLRQPVNSDLSFVQNDFSIMFWVYDTGVNQHCTLVSRDEREFDISRLAAAYGWKLRIYTRNFNGDLRAPDSSSALPQNRWTCVCVVYTEGKEKRVYINGVLDRLITGTDGEYEIDNSTQYALNIGVRSTGGVKNYSAGGVQLALLRIGSGAPSAEQVKKIYDDEKQLFVENAKATLYGSSDVVTALGHDDSSNILHVGTSAGRSEFQGLRRINNTTTAVTTAISASNGLVAEQ